MGDPAATAGLSSADFSAQLQAALKSQSAGVQQTIASETGIDTTNSRVSQGAASAATLVQNGYNPASSADNANLIHAIAGGLCLIPGAGPILGAAVEGLWMIGNVAACPVTNAFASVGIGGGSTQCGKPPCTHTGGDVTATEILSGQYPLPARPKGSFASLVVPALAQAAAQTANCQGGIPPAVIVDACAAIWNQTHAGPPVDYLVPPLALQSSGNLASPGPGPSIVGVTGNVTNAKTGNVNPYIYYGFGPLSRILADAQAPWPGPVAPPNWQPWPFFPSYGGATSPRGIRLNSGALLPPPAPAPTKNLALHLGPVPAHLAPTTDTAAAPAKAAAPTSSRVPLILAGGAVVLSAAAWQIPAAKAAISRLARLLPR